MRKGDSVTLNMQKPIRIGASLDVGIYSGVVVRYDEKEEYIYCTLESGKLADLSLDVIYECTIHTDKGQLVCTGRIKERYCGAAGKIFKFEIENGFYKINLNKVDKHKS